MARLALADNLADHGIHIARPRLGWQGGCCPECARTKLRPRDAALGVELFADGGARWSCRRCGWKGTVPAEGRPQERRRAPPRPGAVPGDGAPYGAP